MVRGANAAWSVPSGEAALEGVLGNGRKTGPSGPRENASMHFHVPLTPSRTTSPPIGWRGVRLPSLGSLDILARSFFVGGL